MPTSAKRRRIWASNPTASTSENDRVHALQGDRYTVKLFGSIVEMDGRYTVVGIVED